MKNYVMVIDEGTTVLKVLLFDRNMEVVAQKYRNVTTQHLSDGLVAQDPDEIWEQTLLSMRQIIEETGISAGEIAGIGITSQRSTWTMWNGKTGKPYLPFTVWLSDVGKHGRQHFLEDAAFCSKFPESAKRIRTRDSDPVATMYHFAQVNQGFKEALSAPDSLWGTIDTWLVYKLTGGQVHATCTSSASAVTCFDAVTSSWVEEILRHVGLSMDKMPAIKQEVDDYGVLGASLLGAEIPVCALIADQQSALFSGNCHQAGMGKCTMGTGTFVEIHIGSKLVDSDDLDVNVAWTLDGRADYLLEGVSPASGACLEWVKNQLEMVSTMKEMDELAESVPDSAGVYFVPGITGMGYLPFSNPGGRGSFMGLNLAATKRHLLRAALEGVGFASAHVFENVRSAIGDIQAINVDGGVAKSDIVCQTIANVCGSVVRRPALTEATALGAAELAAIAQGWFGKEDTGRFLKVSREFLPCGDREAFLGRYSMWLKAVERSKDWV